MSEIIASTYEIIKEIGSGGGGVVYLANHLRLEKRVILKADKRKITTRSDFLRREVDILKELSHEYIPQVYDFFIEDEIVYTVIDYIEGESLDKPLKRGEKFSQPQVIKWAIQILEALNYLHNPIHGNPPKGYVHSDIKPANIMKRANGDICLIDFNIALALGEENSIGCSKGYASPEHYGLDFSSGRQTTTRPIVNNDSGTEILPLAREQRTKNRKGTSSLESGSSESLSKRTVVPDVRSDIYSLGATLYHLLSGRRPDKDARNVIPLSKKDFTPQIVDIITKAMNPNPDLRYQSAREMLNAFMNVYSNDIRTVRWTRNNFFAYTSLLLLLIAGILTTFIGLKRMQASERWMRLTEDAQNVLLEGNNIDALRCVMQVYDEQKRFLSPEVSSRTQKTLTDILGVYDVSDDFEVYKTIQLPSEPLDLKISPDGSTAVCICSGNLIIMDLEKTSIVDSLPAHISALAEVEYVDADTIVYAGINGVAAYNILTGQMMWEGMPATAIAVSEDKSTVAAVYKDDDFAIIYDALSGDIRSKAYFGEKYQRVASSDLFINPSDNIFTLNNDGTLLAISFADGSLILKNISEEKGNDIEIFDDTVEYAHFEGGFYRQYFAFSATTGKQEESVFAVIDTESVTQVGGFESDGYYFTNSDACGVIVGVDNILVRIDPVSGEQQPLVDTAEKISRYCYDGEFTMVSSYGKVFVFDDNSNEICSFERNVDCNLLAIKGDTAIIGSTNSSVLWIARYENHSETEIVSYDSAYVHDEARLSSDSKTVMLFSYKSLRIYDLNGDLLNEASIPNANEVYDQQYIRDGTESYLEVTYRDGLVNIYDGSTGEILETKSIDIPDSTLYEELETEHYRVESPLHGIPKVYRKDTGEMLAELNEDAYLTYFTETGKYLIAQYVTTDNRFYGYLMDNKFHILAYLPNLCDILEDDLLFDYPSGTIRKVKIYELSELLNIARLKMEEENSNEN